MVCPVTDGSEVAGIGIFAAETDEVRIARGAAVISSPDLGVVAVAAEGVLCAFCCVLYPLSEHCRRRRARVNPLVVAVFRTKQLLRERCAATCLRRRRPGQARRRQGGLQITAVRRSFASEIGPVEVTQI